MMKADEALITTMEPPHDSSDRVAVPTDCTHCGLPVPKGLIRSDSDQQFCCSGCATAFQLIHSVGLAAFYQMIDSPPENQTLRSRGDRASHFEHFDDESFLRRFASKVSTGQLQITMALVGIHCAACVWLVEKLPQILPGVMLTQVNWSAGTIKLRWQTETVSLSQISTALYRLGYTPQPLRTSDKAVRRQNEQRQHLTRIGIAAAAAGNNMLIAAALYLGLFSSMEAGFVSLLRWASCIVGMVSLLGPGRIFFRSALAALRTRTPHMDLPIALGLGVGAVTGLFNTIRGAGEIYFDSLSVLVFLLLVGRWIQFRQQNRAADAIELLYRLTPQRARKLVDGNVVDVIVEEITVGDQLELRPGDLIPVDCEIVDGSSQVDEAILTGESQPAARTIGSQLAAGTKNLSSLLIAQATAVGAETRISKIVELVESASLEKPELVQWANRIGGYFVVIVMVLAGLTFGIWVTHDLGLATDRAAALLIVACPCALAMATPLAIAVALGRMAKRRIMIKSGDVLQALNQPGMIWLDKTGTLTEGKLQVVNWVGNQQWIRVVGAIESKFTHPIAVALKNFGIDDEELEAIEPTIENRIADSQGVSAKFRNQNVLIGNRSFLIRQGVRFDSVWNEHETQLLQRHCSPCWVAVDGSIVGLAGLGDRIRADARDTVEVLRNNGWTIGVLSGDHPSVVQAVATELGIENVRAGVTPEEKLATLRESNQKFSTTVMVGDGVNDSAALAAATVGIAVHNGAEASLAAAPVYLGSAGLAPIAELIAGSRTTCRTIRRNFAASLAYNVLGAGLAMAGLIHPLLAAVLMPISSLTVIGISLRAGRFED